MPYIVTVLVSNPTLVSLPSQLCSVITTSIRVTKRYVSMVPDLVEKATAVPLFPLIESAALPRITIGIIHRSPIAPNVSDSVRSHTLYPASFGPDA